MGPYGGADLYISTRWYPVEKFTFPYLLTLRIECILIDVFTEPH